MALSSLSTLEIRTEAIVGKRFIYTVREFSHVFVGLSSLCRLMRIVCPSDEFVRQYDLTISIPRREPYSEQRSKRIEAIAIIPGKAIIVALEAYVVSLRLLSPGLVFPSLSQPISLSRRCTWRNYRLSFDMELHAALPN